MSQVNAMDFLGKMFRYRPRYDAQISEYFPKFNQGKVVSVVANLPELGRTVELCFSDDDTAFYSLDALEFLELVPDDTAPASGRILAIIPMVPGAPESAQIPLASLAVLPGRASLNIQRPPSRGACAAGAPAGWARPFPVPEIPSNAVPAQSLALAGVRYAQH